jgi:hypothetical protein
MAETVDRSVQDALAHARSARFGERGIPDPHLNFGSGDGTLPPMDTVDAKIAAVEARTDTKFAELRGDLKDFATKSTVWRGVAVVIATLLAAMAFGGDRFDAGIGMADVRQAQMQKDADQDKTVHEINGKLDQLIAAQRPAAPSTKK